MFILFRHSWRLKSLANLAYHFFEKSDFFIPPDPDFSSPGSSTVSVTHNRGGNVGLRPDAGPDLTEAVESAERVSPRI
jgi:hypothetical protein